MHSSSCFKTLGLSVTGNSKSGGPWVSTGSVFWVLKAQFRVLKNGTNCLMLETECWRRRGNSLFMVISSESLISCKKQNKNQTHKHDMASLRAGAPSAVNAGSQSWEMGSLWSSLSALRTAAPTQMLVFKWHLPPGSCPQSTSDGRPLPFLQQAPPLNNKLLLYDCVSQGALPLSNWDEKVTYK